MAHEKSFRETFFGKLHGLIKKSPGQIMAMFALSLPVIFAAGGLAVDAGHLMVSRNVLKNAADAGAFAFKYHGHRFADHKSPVAYSNSNPSSDYASPDYFCDNAAPIIDDVINRGKGHE